MYEITTGIKLICLSVCKSCQCIRLQVLSTSSALMSFPCSISVSMSWDSDAVLQISDPQHHTNGHKTYLTKQNITSPCITSDHITSHYITLRYTTLHYTKPHYTTSHYITLHCTTLHYITLHYTTLHYITLHYTTLHYITPPYTHVLHYVTQHHATLHCITLHDTTRQYTTLYSSIYIILIQTNTHTQNTSIQVVPHTYHQIRQHLRAVKFGNGTRPPAFVEALLLFWSTPQPFRKKGSHIAMQADKANKANTLPYLGNVFSCVQSRWSV